MRRLAAAALLGAAGAQTTDQAAARSCAATYRRNACVADVVEVIQLKKHERAGDCCALCLSNPKCEAVTYYADHKCALSSTTTTTECSEGRTALRRAPPEGLCRLGGGWDRLCRDVPKRLAFALMSVARPPLTSMQKLNAWARPDTGGPSRRPVGRALLEALVATPCALPYIRW